MNGFTKIRLVFLGMFGMLWTCQIQAQLMEDTSAYPNLRNKIKDQDFFIKNNPNNPKPYIRRAECKFELNDFKGSLGDFTKALELDPKSDLVYSKRSNVKYTMGDYRGSISDLDQAIALNPADMTHYYNRLS